MIVESTTVCPSRIQSRTNEKGSGVIVYTITYVFVILLFPRFYRLSTAYNASVSIWIKLIAYCILGICGIRLFRERFKEGILQWKTHPVKNCIWFIAMFIGDIILSNLAMLPLALLYPDYESVNQINLETASDIAPAFIMLLSLGILGPVTEEMIFRFTLVDRAKSKFPAALCVCGSSLLFMLIHVHAMTIPDFLSNLPMLVSGILFAICMLKTKNPTLPVLIHILNNAAAFLPLFFRHN